MRKPKTPPEQAVTAYYDQFRKRLIAMREEDVGVTQAVMAGALGVSLARYQKYELRDKFPLHLIPKLSVITHRDVEFIVTGRSSRPRLVRDRAA